MPTSAQWLAKQVVRGNRSICGQCPGGAWARLAGRADCAGCWQVHWSCSLAPEALTGSLATASAGAKG